MSVAASVRAVAAASGAASMCEPTIAPSSPAASSGHERSEKEKARGSRRRRALFKWPARARTYFSSLTTQTLTFAFTPRPSFTWTSVMPSVLMGSSRWIFLESTLTPWAASASAMSREVTEP